MSTLKKIPLSKVIRISERVILPQHEFRVKEIMASVPNKVKHWPGLISIETLVDTQEPNKYIVITKWEDKGSMKSWHESPICKQVKAQLDEALAKDAKNPDGNVTYRELMYHEDNVFLL